MRSRSFASQAVLAAGLRPWQCWRKNTWDAVFGILLEDILLEKDFAAVSLQALLRILDELGYDNNFLADS